MSNFDSVHLYTFYSQDYLPLKKRFDESLKDDYIVHYIPFDIDKKGTGVGGGIQTWVFKTEKIIELIGKHKGNIIIFSDIDIQFFRKTEPIIRESMDRYEIVFQRENRFGNVNIGFMVFKCNNTVLDFWKKVLEKVLYENTWDQKAVNDLLFSNNRLNWGLFPDSVWNWGLSSRWKSIVLHHSTHTSNMNTKLMQMRIVSAVYFLKWLNRFDIIYTLSRTFYRLYKMSFERNRITN